MNGCKKCEVLKDGLLDGVQWTLTTETQKCIWVSLGEMPVVDVHDAESIACFCCEEHAMTGVWNYLFLISAREQRVDTRPIEACACCEADIETKQPHKVLVLSRDAFDGNSIEQLDVRYLARFCNKCVPI